jgi:hypothetical protein
VWILGALILNRTQLLAVGFFAFVWIALVAILVFAPSVYSQTLGQVPVDARVLEATFLFAVTALIALLVVGIIGRWRWTFWLVMLAFALGALRLPASALELAGLVPASGPGWYELLQGAIGGLQFLIALAMFAGYRKSGVWGEF